MSTHNICSHRDISGMGLIYFVWKPLILDLNSIYIWPDCTPIQAIQIQFLIFILGGFLGLLDPSKFPEVPSKFEKAQILNVSST